MCLRARARVLCVSARTPVNGGHHRCALTALSNFLTRARCEVHNKDNKVESWNTRDLVTLLPLVSRARRQIVVQMGMNELKSGETAPEAPIGELMGAEWNTEDNSDVWFACKYPCWSIPELIRDEAPISKFSHLKTIFLYIFQCAQ